MSSFSLLTYNLHFNCGLQDLSKIVKVYSPDILCLQEYEENDESFLKLKSLGYDLAGYSDVFVNIFTNITYSVATFHKQDRFKFVNAKFFNLPLGFYDYFQKTIRKKVKCRTVLVSQIQTKESKINLYIYNVHLSSMGTHMIRIKQLKCLGNNVSTLEKIPAIIAGDMNFPYRRKKLEKIIENYNVKEATKNIFYTSIQNYLGLLVKKVKLDYIFYKNMAHKKTEVISNVSSDHFALYSEFMIES
jgi:endonuclease/exonuclease/phosphatase family metal-dependent hydrolase